MELEIYWLTANCTVGEMKASLPLRNLVNLRRIERELIESKSSYMSVNMVHAERRKPPRTCWRSKFQQAPRTQPDQQWNAWLSLAALDLLQGIVKLVPFLLTHASSEFYELTVPMAFSIVMEFKTLATHSIARLDGFMCQSYACLQTTATCIDFPRIPETRHL